MVRSFQTLHMRSGKNVFSFKRNSFCFEGIRLTVTRLNLIKYGWIGLVGLYKILPSLSIVMSTVGRTGLVAIKINLLSCSNNLDR